MTIAPGCLKLPLLRSNDREIRVAAGTDLRFHVAEPDSLNRPAIALVLNRN
jgi:hypothetical protein